MKGTVDGIHALGMKAGTYSDAGANTCGSEGGDKSGLGAGLYGHDAADCKLHFNELGFDFILARMGGGGGRAGARPSRRGYEATRREGRAPARPRRIAWRGNFWYNYAKLLQGMLVWVVRA